jgi:phenylpropionate dioxygenase-like ring-hydroxylating dioxygenase large terminal subunit
MTQDKPRRFGGHDRRTVPAPDALLTAVGPGTACGEWIRRAWQPVAMASEIGDTPLALRILGEDLVLFRDRSGRLGLLHKHCSHRGASLEFGIPMERGLSCCYHGWTYDVDGTVLDIPAEPAGSTLKHRIVHGAYPTREHSGLVFAYLGPPEAIPPFPVLDTMGLPGVTAAPFALDLPCNWLQCYENTQDPVHVVYLHTRMSGAQFGDASGATQVINYRKTPLGMVNVQSRRWGGHYWNRTTESILPNCNQGGAIWEEAEREKVFQRVAFLRWMVPRDDTHTVIMGWRFFSPELDPKGLGDPAKVGKQTIDFVGQTEEERPYRERQKQPGDYEVLVSQRPVAVHALENLAQSDRGVAMLRRLIRQGITALQNGEAPAPYPARADGVVPTYCQDTVWPWPQMAADEGEQAMLGRFGEAIADSLLEDAGIDDERRRARLRQALAAAFPGKG